MLGIVVKMHLKFTKMQALGNDFIVLNGITQKVTLTPTQYQHLANRHFGIGCDQFLIIEAARQVDTDFYYRIINADGGEVEQCGNGARCFAKYVFEKGLTRKREIRVETISGIIVPRLENDDQVTVKMGSPRFDPLQIPFLAEAAAITYPLLIGNIEREISVVSMGNPHAIQIVEDLSQAPVGEEGPLIESHIRFPQRVNAGYMQIIDRNHIQLRVYERGAGETLACGTGACAAVVSGIRRGLLDPNVEVTTRGGKLIISWSGGDHPVLMTGPAVTVYEGEIKL